MPDSRPAMSPADAIWVRELVRRRSAIVLDESKQYLIDTRLAPIVRSEGLGGVGELVARARAGDRRVVGLVVDAMTTNETSWFRDNGPFELLRTAVLPYLVRARGSERRLRIWSAACSSGQEAYSVAMLCTEVVPPGWSVEIIGTDLSPAMVARAREGRFSQLEVNRGLPASHLVRWFTRDGAHWRVAPELQRMTSFREGNLAEPFTDLGRFDVVLLRNVLIYFDGATKVDILRRVRGVTRPDGVLLLGAAESALGLDVGWNRETVAGSSVLRQDGAPSLSTTRAVPSLPPAGGVRPPLPRQAPGTRPLVGAPKPVRPLPTTRTRTHLSPGGR
ncbi:CheR family methyltransferase [Aquipuribacter nitratireducens]|uniref:protein-glutamate O-methyltransferase n=1 Tax=Aquipuribacter nitratireducens TaxID=650104 RepID=A0ABW0GQ82_9MICO